MAPITPRGPNQEFSPHKRTRIVVGWSLGLSPQYLHAKEGVATGSIHGIVTRYRVQKSGRSLPRSGRPRILTESHIQRVLRLIDQDPFISAKEIHEKVRLPCSERTILRELIRLGIQHYKAIRRPKLTEEHAEKRLQFARKYVDKPLAWWKRVIFSDESTVARGEGERQKWVFCLSVCKLPPIIPPPI
jgi:transposase